MAFAMTEEMSASLQRGFSEWWSEEREYIVQRIERWAALARGYNRLRSQRLSRGRLTMQEEQEPHWSISSNKIVIEDPNWCPRFYNLKRSHRRKSRNDEIRRINCCGTFDYQSSRKLDSNCLENYRYDHSIYFKTIGDIKSSKRESVSGNEENSLSNDEHIEWEVEKPKDLFNNFNVEEDDEYDDESDEFSNENDDVRSRINDFPTNLSGVEKTEDRETHRVFRNVWPIVDLNKLSLNTDNDRVTNESRKIDSVDRQMSNDSGFNADESGITSDDSNNNFKEDNVDSTEKMIQLQIAQLTANQRRLNSTIESTNPQKNHVGLTRNTSVRKSRRGSKKVRQPAIVGENNVLWPGVLLTYTKNVNNAALEPHHYRAVQNELRYTALANKLVGIVHIHMTSLHFLYVEKVRWHEYYENLSKNWGDRR